MMKYQMAFSERNILALGSQNRFMTKLHSAFQNKDYLFFVMEYLDGGDLMFHFLAEGRFTEDRARFYTAELVLGLQFLHSNGIIHRDLKLENVMLTSEGHIKLVDLGIAKDNLKNRARTTTFCGTATYIPPEMLNSYPYGASVDWWSLGILLYQMMSGRSPFDHDNDEILFQLIQHRQVVTPSTFSKESQDIIRGLLQKDTKNRLGCKEDIGEQEIRDHPFFFSINWADLEQGKVTPPFQPTAGEAEDAANFESQFTDQSTALVPLEMEGNVRKLADDCFIGFSFYNVNYNG
jgi:serine/threonine protein kinase